MRRQERGNEIRCRGETTEGTHVKDNSRGEKRMRGNKSKETVKGETR